MSILVIDTETTGLSPAIDRIVSLSYIIFNSDGEETQRVSNIIRTDFHIGNSDFHGITDKISHDIGIPIIVALADLSDKIDTETTTIVAHNWAFDRGMLVAEAMRLGAQDLINKLLRAKSYCTMVNGSACIGGYRKWIKLTKLHELLFGEPTTHSHESLADAYYCSRCYFKLIAKSS
jgi:DNA polymerase III epsilon subunit-like protein